MRGEEEEERGGEEERRRGGGELVDGRVTSVSREAVVKVSNTIEFQQKKTKLDREEGSELSRVEPSYEELRWEQSQAGPGLERKPWKRRMDGRHTVGGTEGRNDGERRKDVLHQPQDKTDIMVSSLSYGGTDSLLCLSA